MKKIKNIFKEFLKSEYAPFLYFALIIFMIMLKMTIKDGSDDTVSIKQLSEMSALKWVYLRATTWQPRISVDLAVALVNFNIPIWKFNTVAISTMLVITISYILNHKLNIEKKRLINILVCSSFFLIAPHVITASVLWCTGSYYYLWSALALILSLAPFYYAIKEEKITYKNMYIVYFFASAYASYVEQPFAILICFGIFTFIYLFINNKKIPKMLVGQYIFIITNVIIYFSIGGVNIREQAELYWYRDYTMLSSIDKIFQGINWSNYQLINSSNVLMSVFTCLIFVTIWIKNKDKVVRFFSIMPFIFIILSVLPIESIFSNISYLQDPYTGEVFHLDMAHIFRDGIFNCMLARPNNFLTGFKYLLPSAICFTVILFISVLLFIVFEKVEDKIVAVILYFASLASSYVISFTPTIFASRYRVFFITDILIVLLIGMVMKELLKEDFTLKHKLMKVFIGTIIFLASCFAIEQFVFIWNGGFRV